MSLTDDAQQAFVDIRASLGGNTVRKARWGSKVYEGTNSPLSMEQSLTIRGEAQSANGAIRFTLAELPRELPVSGDIVEIYNYREKVWQERIVDGMRFDQPNACVRMEYTDDSSS